MTHGDVRVSLEKNPVTRKITCYRHRILKVSSHRVQNPQLSIPAKVIHLEDTLFRAAETTALGYWLGNIPDPWHLGPTGINVSDGLWKAGFFRTTLLQLNLSTLYLFILSLLQPKPSQDYSRLQTDVLVFPMFYQLFMRLWIPWVPDCVFLVFRQYCGVCICYIVDSLELFVQGNVNTLCKNYIPGHCG